MTNIYVGNLSYDATDQELRKLFEPYGQVKSSSIIKDRESGKSRGFGFVEMDNAEEAKAAIAALNGKAALGRNLVVNEARPKEEGGRGGSRPAGAAMKPMRR